MDYKQRIEKIREEIRECNSVIAHYPLKVDSDSSSPKTKKISPLKKTKDRTFDLDKFIRKMDKVDQLRKEKEAMRQIMRHGKVTQDKTVTDMDTFMDELNKKRFCVPWNRLDTWQKKNRMKKYVAALDITAGEKEKLVSEYGEEILKNSFGKMVKYDKNYGCILSIKVKE